MDWIDKLNKELEERRNHNKTSEARDEAQERVKIWKSSLGGQNSPWTKDCKNQSYAGKERAKNGGKEQLAGVRTKKSQSDGGKKTGPKNVESGHWKKCQEKALEIVTQKLTCPHCGLTSNYNIMKGKHFDKCKWLKIDKNKIIELGLSGMKYGQIANQLDIKEWLVKKVMREYKSQNS
jgi:hypothetical protein